MERQRTPIGRGTTLAGTVAAAFLGLVGVLAALKVVPGPAVLIFLFMSVIAFVLYRADKSAAKQGSWRVPESRLHLVSLVGGWPGALLAQQIYHHKTRKQSFQIAFWITVFVNCAVLAWVAFEQPLAGL